MPAGYRAIHAVVVRREPAHGRERRLAPRPHALAFAGVLRGPHAGRAGCDQHGARPGQFVVDVFRQPVDFAQQQRGGVERVAAVREGFGRLDRGRIHHLETGRHDAGGDHVAHGVGAAADVVKSGEQQFDAARQRQQAHRHLDDHAEQAFGADHGREQVEAGRLASLRADGEHVALHRHELHREHVVHGEPVLEAVDAARILRHVAADRTRDLRRRIGRVVEAVRCGRFRHGEVGDARLHARQPAPGIDLEDPVESRQHEQQAACDGQRAAGKPRARPARDHWHRMPAADAQHVLHLLDRLRQRDEVGGLAVGGERVAFEGDAGSGIDEQSGPEHGPQLSEQLRVSAHWAGAAARPCRCR